MTFARKYFSGYLGGRTPPAPVLYSYKRYETDDNDDERDHLMRVLCCVVRAWEWTNSCYQRLLDRCQNDVIAVRNIRHDIGRYVVYYEPCKQRKSGTLRRSMSLRSYTLLFRPPHFQDESPTPSPYVILSVSSSPVLLSIKPNPHRRRRRDSTRQLSRDGVGGVYWALLHHYIVHSKLKT